MAGGNMRTLLRYLILALVFIPGLALWLHEKPRPAGPHVERDRASIARDVSGTRLHAP
jgi:hypothetical protein